MNPKEWEDNINNINTNDYVKSHIIQFISEFGHRAFYTIDNDELLFAFNNINNYKPIITCFDIEFQSAILTNAKGYIHYPTINDDKAAKFIRELGVLLFIRDADKNVHYVGHIFINFNKLEHYGFNKYDSRVIGAEYSTVDKSTKDKSTLIESNFNIDNRVDILFDDGNFGSKKYWDEIPKIINFLKSNYIFNNLLKDKAKEKILEMLNNLEKHNDYLLAHRDLKFIKKQLHNAQFESYGRYLNEEYKKFFVELNNYYWSDKQVKSRIIKKEKSFMEQFRKITDDSLLVVKGTMDIMAVKNMSMLILGENIFKLEQYYDIETFNGFSNTKYHGSQLEETFKELIKTDLYKKYAKNFFDKIGAIVGNKAHNPVVDSFFTIVVSVVINLGLNNCFDSKFIGGRILEYKKYKDIYKKIRR